MVKKQSILLRSETNIDENGCKSITEFYGYLNENGEEVITSTFKEEERNPNLKEESGGISEEELQLSRDEIMLDISITLEEIKANQEIMMAGGKV